MKTGKYLQESLNFISALQQMKQEKAICSQSNSVMKSQLSQYDIVKNSVENRVDERKYTKRTNLNLKQLLEQYIQNSENQYILTLRLGGIQEKKHELFDVWISQLSQKQSNHLDVSRKKQNGAKTQNQIILTKQKIFVKSGDENKSKNDHQKLPNTYPTSGQQKTTDKTTRQTTERGPQKQCQQQKQFKIISRQQNEVQDDKVVQQLEEISIHDQSFMIKRRLIQKLSHEMSQNQKENAGPTQNRQQKEVKVLQFSKAKRYKSCKKKRKHQI